MRRRVRVALFVVIGFSLAFALSTLLQAALWSAGVIQ